MKRRILYMIHYSDGAGAIRHYAGSTTDERLSARLHEHRKGTGTTRTADAKKAGFQPQHYFVAPMRHPLLEKVLSFEHVCVEACPVCTPPGANIFIRQRSAGKRFEAMHVLTKREARRGYKVKVSAP